jgi:hypothetical protein
MDCVSAMIPYVVLRDGFYNIVLNAHALAEDKVMLKTLTEKCHFKNMTLVKVSY